MTDCGCDKAKAELEEYLHQELSDDDFRDVSEHLANCEDCSAEHLVGVTLTEKVRRACRETAPEELRQQVLLKIRQLQA
ncbi:zf-HC2 domain-containing protein [Lysobacter korlensis]|uniref:Zf-HC2 domain-containing protein n=1 Tax=Lysobacter korlensis TaxID=553636 RepID=A0ABV6RVT7_9GAMM